MSVCMCVRMNLCMCGFVCGQGLLDFRFTCTVQETAKTFSQTLSLSKHAELTWKSVFQAMLQIPFFPLNMLGCNEWNGVSKTKRKSLGHRTRWQPARCDRYFCFFFSFKMAIERNGFKLKCTVCTQCFTLRPVPLPHDK